VYVSGVVSFYLMIMVVFFSMNVFMTTAALHPAGDPDADRDTF
jgi:hypothetical protein